MKLILLASLIILASTISLITKRQSRKHNSSEKSFWEREKAANSVRRKPLDNLEYITIPLEKLPTGILKENSKVAEYIEIIESLSGQPIVNLTGYTNTDLKLEYGTANITVLTEYDQRYTLLARTLQQWADILLEQGYTDEAVTLMEFAIETHTDVSRTYYKLGEIYASHIETERVRELIAIAETLRSSNKDIIVRTLQESYL